MANTHLRIPAQTTGHGPFVDARSRRAPLRRTPRDVPAALRLSARDVERLVARLLARCTDAPLGAPTVQGPIARRHYSVIFRTNVGIAKTPLVAKFFVDPNTGAPDKASARRQYSALERVYRHLWKEPEYRVPRPYLVDEEHGLLLSEWIDGGTMTEHMMLLHTRPSDAVTLVANAGRWLRRFHDAHPLDERPVDVEGVLANVPELRASALAANESVVSALEALQRHADRVAASPVSRSWVHGDFEMDNLIVAGNAIFGIDIHLRHENAVLYDVAAFTNHLDLTLLHPWGLRMRPWRARLVDAVKASYDERCSSAWRAPFAWIALYLLLGDWNEFRRRETTSLRHRYQRACFDVLVSRRTSELASAVASNA